MDKVNPAEQCTIMNTLKACMYIIIDPISSTVAFKYALENVVRM